jgi:deoxyhypusine synthase
MAQLYLKKLKAQYAYLKVECEYNDSIYKDAIHEFNEYFKDKINLKAEEKELKTTNRASMITKKKLKPTVDKIYKKLAQKLHPDKRTGTEEAFRELQDSIEKKDMDRVIELAEEYEVDISLVVDTEEFYTQNISDLEEKLKHQNTTLAMLWHNAEESTRERLEQKIISHYGE